LKWSYIHYKSTTTAAAAAQERNIPSFVQLKIAQIVFVVGRWIRRCRRRSFVVVDNATLLLASWCGVCMSKAKFIIKNKVEQRRRCVRIYI